MDISRIALGALALALFTQTAGAADLPRRPAPAPQPSYLAPVPVYNWTGLYVGGHVGYGWATVSVDAANASVDGDGWFGGGQIGYNWQAMGSPWVWGLEADASFFSGDINWFGTGRARAGYANGPWLTYVTGGVAWANTDVLVGSLSESQTHVGWTAGAGFEWAFAPQWSAKLEYLYLGLGNKTYNLGGTKFEADINANIVRLGVNYRFGT